MWVISGLSQAVFPPVAPNCVATWLETLTNPVHRILSFQRSGM